MQAQTSRRLAMLFALALVSVLNVRLATAQSAAAKSNAPAAAQTQPATAPATQAAEAPPSTGSQESGAPSADAPPLKESEHLSFMQDGEREASAEAPSAGGLLIRTFGALLLIVGLIVAVGWGMRRFGGARFGAKSENAPALNVLTSVALGDRRSLAVVRFGGRNLLIGSTAQSIALLATDDAGEGGINAPLKRSVADLLKDEETEEFSAQLMRAGRRLEDRYADRLEDEDDA